MSLTDTTGEALLGLDASEESGLLNTEIQPDAVEELVAQNLNVQGTPVPKEETKEDFNLGKEVSSVIGGGAIDAVESVGGFAELTGDTLKTGLSHMLGQPVDATQNPFDENYVSGDADWLNIPDKIYNNNGEVIWEDAQPTTAIGRFGRGLVEFGILSVGTGMAGGAALGGVRTGTRALAAARSMGLGARGTRALKFLGKGVKIGSEGAIADLISSSSEHANIMNLAQDNIPWAVPIIGDMIAVAPEDNPWEARLKTIMAGAGLNYVGHAIGAVYKGFWASGRARKAGKTVDEANQIGNETAAADFDANMARDEAARTEMALDSYEQGNGLSRADKKDEFMRNYLPEEYDEWVAKNRSELDEDVVRTNELQSKAEATGKEAGDEWDELEQSSTLQREADELRDYDPFVNDDRFEQTEKSTYRSEEDGVRRHTQEAINDMKAGGEGRSSTPMISESYLKAMSRGDRNLRQYIEEVADDLAEAATRTADNQLNWKDTKTLILKQANDLLEILEGGGDIAVGFKKALDDPQSYRVYADNGNQIITISPSQKAANVLVMQALAKQVEGIAKGTVAIADNVPIGRQAEQIFDAMKVLITENKKMGLMWGLDGKAQQQYVLSPTLANMKQKGMKEIADQTDEYIEALRSLIRDKKWDDLDGLIELHALSGGKVRTLEHIHEYLRSVITGGRMDDIHIKGRVRKELQGTFFNSVLSSFATPIKAVVGTNMIAMLRPMQAWMGAALKGNDKEMFIAAAQIDGLGKAWAEGLQMAKYNWDLGVKRQGQSYQGKFDFDTDLQGWKKLKRHYERFGSDSEKMAYGALDKVVDFNTSPFVKYSMNAMGSGDALARTIIGRQYMRQRSALAAWDGKGGNTLLSSDELMNMARDGEDAFRDEIFKLDKNGRYVVTEKGASMAGDMAAMTRGLQENFKGFELIANIPGMKAFFPFVRTGFNYLDVTFQHTPLAAFRDKYRDLTGFMTGHKGSRNLDKYGIRPQDLEYEIALMEGRMAMGTAVIGLATIAALSGRMTGDLPMDKRDRDLWKINGIKPKSFKLADGTYVSYEKLEIFNTLFSTTANVVGYSDVIGEKRTDEWMKKLTYMTAAVVVDQSMLSGVEDLARLMNPQTAEDLLLGTGSRFVRSHLPFAGLSGQIGDILDSNEKEANTFWEMAIKRDALFKSTLNPKYDVLSKDRTGKPLHYGPENPGWKLVNSNAPVAITSMEGDEVKQALHAIRFNMPETLSTYQGEPLNSYEQSEMERMLSMGDLRKDLFRIIRHPNFQKSLNEYKTRGLKEADGYKLNDQLFYAAVASSFRTHKKIAMQKLLAQNPDLASRLAKRKYQKMIGKTGQYEQVEYLLSAFPK